MARKYLVLLLFSVIPLLLGSCGNRNSANNNNNSGYDISIETESTSLGATNLKVTIKDSEGAPVNDASVNIKGDMAHAGMAPVLGESSNGENGTYLVPYEWTMAGDWIVSIEVVLADGTVVTDRIDFSGIGGDDGMDDMDMEDMDLGNDS